MVVEVISQLRFVVLRSAFRTKATLRKVVRCIESKGGTVWNRRDGPAGIIIGYSTAPNDNTSNSTVTRLFSRRQSRPDPA